MEKLLGHRLEEYKNSHIKASVSVEIPEILQKAPGGQGRGSELPKGQ